jgi:hypothetical protein
MFRCIIVTIMRRRQHCHLIFSFLTFAIVIDKFTSCFALQNPAPCRVGAKIGFREYTSWNHLNRMARADNSDWDINALEKEVVASTQAKLDLKRVTDALGVNVSPNTDPEKTAMLEAPWRTALAAAFAASTISLLATNNPTASTVAFIGVFFLANRDPMDEEGAFGAFARLLGRVTIKSVESSKPKLRAMARAAITSEEEILRLQQRVNELEEEKASLLLWKQRRLAVDESMSEFPLDELKEKARQNKLPVGGTKSKLLMRLVEENIIKL